MSDESSEEQLSAVLATTDEWYETFAESPEFARLSDSHQRKAGAITEFFAKYTYEYLGLSPGEWDSGAVAECCTEILPRKVTAEPVAGPYEPCPCGSRKKYKFCCERKR